MIARALVVAFSFFSFAVCAQTADPSTFVVKVTSSKNGESVFFGGSGVLVVYKGQPFVLTSEHVLLHDNDQSTHQIQFDGGTPLPATYLLADWGMGLALLKIKPELIPNLAALPDLEALAKAPAPAKGGAAMSVGFPYHGTSIVADATGVVDSTTTSSEILVDVEKMLQISGAHAEFGMSGGAVIGDDGSLLAILSHETPDPAKKVIYGIPIAPAARWTIRAITDPSFKPELMRTSSDMLLEGRYGLQVRAGLFALKWSTYPCGNSTTRVVDIEPDRSWIDAPTCTPSGPFYTSLLKRFEEYRAEPRYYPTVYLTGFRSPDLAQAKSTWFVVDSFVGFFRTIRRTDVRPVARFDHQGLETDQVDFAYDQVADRLRRLTYEANGATLGPALTQFQDYITYYENSETLDISRDYPIFYLNHTDIEDLLNGPTYAQDWRAMQRHSSDDYDQLRQALKDLETQIDQVSI